MCLNVGSNGVTPISVWLADTPDGMHKLTGALA